MDKISIKDLEVYAYHGVFKEEKEKGQKFYICADLYLSTRNAGCSDNLELSVNYGDVCGYITEVMQEETFDLIETAAEHVAEALLLKFRLIHHLSLEIKKPEAPIDLPFGCISVTIERGWHKVYVALGSNIGDRSGYFEMALSRLKEEDTCEVTRVSDYIVTEPYGGVEQDDFLNGAIELDTLLDPEELLSLLHVIENEAGRERKIHWGPRTLDLDILFYDDMIYDSEDLAIPHPEIAKREFVLIPMAQIAGYLRHPVNGKTVKEMLEDLDNCKDT
ncbi:MAG: 2-amino-4-hydroxy-6-hydroxymethyldihydropteridine diphosphokinase [Lachnospiraceae bacterium]|nr:2-amino-4-hydroxy-6-hydroxymethyldihydropteridine diphosphokinase [Lachnospiraceae bacterium]